MIIQGTKVQKFIGYFNRDPRNFYQYLLAAKKGSHHGRSLRRTGEIPFTTSTHNAVRRPFRIAAPPAVARTRFNDATRQYNVTIRRFPANLIAGMFGFDQKAYFAAEEGAQTVPEVKF